MKPVEFILGKRPDHYHGGQGDSACFKTCPVWDYDLKSLKIQFELVTVRMDEVKRCGDSKAGPERMVKLTRRLHSIDDQIKAMQKQ